MTLIHRYAAMMRAIPGLCKSTYRGLIALLFLAASPLPAAVDVQLSQATTSLDQPVMLRLAIEGENDAYPDLSVLERDFEILGRSQQQSVSVINGRTRMTRGITLTLLPKSTGTLIIPAITVGEELSSPLTLEVTAAAHGGEEAAQAGAFIRMELDKTEAYVQEELVLTVRLFLPEGVIGETFSEPRASLEHSEIRLLHEEQYPAPHEGQTYHVVERRYAIHAYQAGRLTLDDIHFRGRMLGTDGQSFFNMLQEPINPPAWGQAVVRAESERVQAEILPIPAAFEGDHWLPASNLRLLESGLKRNAPLTAGKPATLHLVLVADGLTASQLPPIELELPEGLTQYPERPQTRDNVMRDGISGSRHSVVTLVATHPGRYVLPALEIPWWNTQTDRQESARLPAITLEVAAGSAESAPTTPSQPLAQAFDESVVPFAGLDEQTRPGPAARPGLFNWLVWLLLLGWLSTLAAWWYSNRREKTSLSTPVPVADAKAESQERPQNELEDAMLAALESAYRDKNPEAARTAWLKWGRHRWQEHPPSNLNRLAERCPQPIALAVQTLDNAIYSPSSREDWMKFSPRDLLRADDAHAARRVENGNPASV